jgi:hypothetical protein
MSTIQSAVLDLKSNDPDTLVRAINFLIKQAIGGEDISSFAETLYSLRENQSLPSWSKNNDDKIGYRALIAVAIAKLQRGRAAELLSWLDADEQSCLAALQAMLPKGLGKNCAPLISKLKHLTHISPQEKVQEYAKRSLQQKKQMGAVRALVVFYYDQPAWNELTALLRDARKPVQYATIRALDDIAESNANIEPLLIREIIEVAINSEPDEIQIREVAARTLSWVLFSLDPNIRGQLDPYKKELAKFKEFKKLISKIKRYEKSIDKTNSPG